jgi:RNA methyltransferase, TrmH family
MALSKNEIKLIKSLQAKKARETNRLFVVEGVKLVAELLNQEKFRIESIFYTEDHGLELPKKIHSFRVSNTGLERISGLVTPNKILAVVKFPALVMPDWSAEDLVLILDEIKDPGNLGTILRTADWFGVKTILASPGTVDIFNPKVIQASMGAVYRVNFIQAVLEEKIDELKKNGFTVVAADLDGENLYKYTFPSKFALVAGSESHGISDKIAAACDDQLTIPRVGDTESLNVGVATGIILSAFRSYGK